MIEHIKRISPARSGKPAGVPEGEPAAVAVAMVRNEGDIIGAWISHALALFDAVYVADQLSSDGTREFLQEVAETHENVQIFSFHHPGYYQAEVKNHLAEIAAREFPGAWLFPLDADEFLAVGDREELLQRLAEVEADRVLEMAWRNCVPLTLAEDKAFSFTSRLLIPARHGDYQKVAISSAAFTEKGWRFTQGNHEVVDEEGSLVAKDLRKDLADLFHLPIRSLDHFILKCTQTHAAYEAMPPDSRDPSWGFHIREMMERVMAEGTLDPGMVRAFVARYGLSSLQGEGGLALGEMLQGGWYCAPLYVARLEPAPEVRRTLTFREIAGKLAKEQGDQKLKNFVSVALRQRREELAQKDAVPDGCADDGVFERLAPAPAEEGEPSEALPEAEFIRFISPAFTPHEDPLPPTAWEAHVPFLFCLLRYVRPRRFVELGTHFGNSFFAACQAVRDMGLGTECIAVDYWRGDPQAGYYGEEVFARFLQVLHGKYAGIGKYIRKRFDDASHQFEAGSIDLLHIDGLHTYEAVANDFYIWLPKMSASGIVMLHDTHERAEAYEVWRLWEEIKQSYPYFEFEHGHGLGVALVGSNPSRRIKEMFDVFSRPECVQYLQAFFSHIGGQNEVLYKASNIMRVKDAALREREAALREKEAALMTLDRMLAESTGKLEILEAQVENLEAQVEKFGMLIEQVNKRMIVQLVEKYKHVITRILPHGTKRRKLFDLSMAGARVAVNEGWKELLRRSFKSAWADIMALRGTILPLTEKDAFEIKPPKIMKLQGKKLAIVVHAFYMGVFEEICGYLANMPVEYSLFVSVKDEEDRKKAEDLARDLPKVRETIIRVVQNRGRDMAPFLVDFAPVLRDYDYICKIHTKKSTYMHAPDAWRGYLYRMLLGSNERIRAVLTAFELVPELGIIYPETYEGLPYWCHTWLGCKGIAPAIIGRIGATFDPDEYVDMPASSMFWARAKALKPLFDLNLDTESFPEEAGQTDCTLHHTLERCIVKAAEKEGFKKAVLQAEDRQVFSYRGERLFRHYINVPFDQKVRALREDAKSVSFDIFDTLLCRPFSSPDMVFAYLEEQVEREYGVADFHRMRKEAEERARSARNYEGDVKLTEIYSYFGKLAGVDGELSNRLRNLEIATERRLLAPRERVAKLLKELEKEGKKAILCSDTYMEERDVRSILAEKGIVDFDELYLSCEIGKRKDRGDMWDHILEKEGVTEARPLYHLGDNEESDLHILYEKGIAELVRPVHIMKPSILFRHSEIGSLLYDVIRPHKGWRESLLYGVIANRFCNDPEAGTLFSRAFPLSDPHAFGYVVFGPLIYNFMIWLIKTALTDRIDELMFIAREGYVLTKAYDEMVSRLENEGLRLRYPKGKYFLCSRRAALFASIVREEEIGSLLDRYFSGTLRELLVMRFRMGNVREIEHALGNYVLDRNIFLPRDVGIVMIYFKKIAKLILEQARKEREALAGHCSDMGFDSEKKTALVDLGYSGTIQRSLSKIMQHPIAGYYFATDEDANKNVQRGLICRGYYGNMVDPRKAHLPIYDYKLLAEAVLTSPDPMVINFVSEGEKAVPVFDEIGISQDNFHTIMRIQEGALDFVRTMLFRFGRNVIDIEFPNPVIMDIFEMASKGGIEIGRLEDVLYVEDKYCGNREIKVMEWFRNMG